LPDGELLDCCGDAGRAPHSAPCTPIHTNIHTNTHVHRSMCTPLDAITVIYM
jgi:hypothetical protein